MKFGNLISLVCAVLLLTPPARAEITVGAAISMSDAITEISTAYTKETGEKIRHTFSGTNVIARQIEEGAPIDVFISADTATMDGLVAIHLIEKKTVRVIASNELVVVFALAGKKKFLLESAQILIFVRPMTIADPDSVPAGIYAKKWLTAEGVWENMSPRIVRVQNVRAALISVESGNAKAAIVYRSDAVTSKKVSIALVADPKKTGPIEYPAAVVSASKKQEESARFLEFLSGVESLKILAKHGFSAP